MKVLVIAGYCLRVNSSANLCHISYIRGLIESGYEVDLLTVSEKNQNIDNSIEIPNVRNLICYNASLYEQLGSKKNRAAAAQSNADETITGVEASSENTSVTSKLKAKLRSLYGVYGTDNIWCKKASKFRSKEKYDYVISLAYPPTSHRVAELLIAKGRVNTDRWIQIWEDPWYDDLIGGDISEKVLIEEARLLSVAQDIYYVSPLTLHYQQLKFPQSAQKMKWQPLPAYYNVEKTETNNNKHIYGYFGDYIPQSRNLKPFYEAASISGISVNICGRPNNMFCSVGNIAVHPRLPLDQLRPIEEITDVLVFLCNLGGGQIPGKIYQYSATSKIILFILDGSEEEKQVLYKYFSKYNRYVFCENSVESIKEAIDRIESGNLNGILSRPLDIFEPQKIIHKLLHNENG